MLSPISLEDPDLRDKFVYVIHYSMPLFDSIDCVVLLNGRVLEPK